MINPNFKIVKGTNGKLPTMNYETDMGIDFYLAEDISIEPGQSVITDLGITWDPRKTLSQDELNGMDRSGIFLKISHFFSFFFKIGMVIQSRSGRAFNEGIECTNAGVIDQSYRANLKVKLYNAGKEGKKLKTGDKICQGIIYLVPNIVGVDILSQSKERGENGFGSSDKRVEN